MQTTVTFAGTGGLHGTLTLILVSIVVPFWGYLVGSLNNKYWLNPKTRNYNGGYR